MNSRRPFSVRTAGALATAFALLVLGACSGGLYIGVNNGGNAGWWNDGIDSLDFAVIDSSGASAIAVPQFAVVRDISAWAALWADHTANLAMTPGLPAINFSQRMVVGVFLGRRTPPCAHVHLTRVLFDNGRNRMTVEYRETTDGGGCDPTAIAPAELAAVPWTSASVEFIRVD